MGQKNVLLALRSTFNMKSRLSTFALMAKHKNEYIRFRCKWVNTY